MLVHIGVTSLPRGRGGVNTQNEGGGGYFRSHTRVVTVDVACCSEVDSSRCHDRTIYHHPSLLSPIPVPLPTPGRVPHPPVVAFYYLTARSVRYRHPSTVPPTIPGHYN